MTKKPLALLIAGALTLAGGVPLAPMDMMIAAHAKALELAAMKGGDTAMLITRDRAFWRVPGGLALDDWTQQELS